MKGREEEVKGQDGVEQGRKKGLTKKILWSKLNLCIEPLISYMHKVREAYNGNLELSG